MVLRPESIEKSDGLKMRFGYWMVQRKPGTVKVVTACLPESLGLTLPFHANGIQIEPELKPMVGTLTAESNGRGFCVGFAQSGAIRRDLGTKTFSALTGYQTSPLFSDQERVALAYAEGATRKTVSVATFKELRTHFDDREIVEITWLNVTQKYINLINIQIEIKLDHPCVIAKSKTWMEHDERMPAQNAQE
ncbi:carboxymuconolactone decarboxylase family protein [Halocatena pleomorpha]|uniref:Carboxymuconolactone decarboxylase family protein n=1 Tax=Halocatena pleomorpha TaxID=1785090 RepID=A0A3P3R9P1_9EURY|nr:carboxymuconolactone decarboxylase family protein [Halocatena pleomorpha]RRJ29400.1 carboxymuconolactone decarboxylase family protein [Halocatena pleomorpha]